MKKFFLALLLTAGTILKAPTSFNISQVYAVEEDDTINLNIGEVAKEKEVTGTASYDPEDGEAGFGELLGQILNIVVTIAALMLLVMLLWGGIEWISAGGDKSKIEKARNRISQSIIGIIVLAGTVALFMLVQKMLDFEVINLVYVNTETKLDVLSQAQV